MDNRPNIKSKMIKLLEEIIGQYLCNLGVGKDFLRKTGNTDHKRKKKIGKLDFIKIKHLQGISQWSSG